MFEIVYFNFFMHLSVYCESCSVAVSTPSYFFHICPAHANILSSHSIYNEEKVYKIALFEYKSIFQFLFYIDVEILELI